MPAQTARTIEVAGACGMTAEATLRAWSLTSIQMITGRMFIADRGALHD